ncbi:hypothetical protein [Actinophytocola sp. KF-1]
MRGDAYCGTQSNLLNNNEEPPSDTTISLAGRRHAGMRMGCLIGWPSINCAVLWQLAVAAGGGRSLMLVFPATRRSCW